jgi:hypothetical protein
MARVGDRMVVSAVLLVGGDWVAAEDLPQGALERTYLGVETGRVACSTDLNSIDHDR